jgi:hypothetical protein
MSHSVQDQNAAQHGSSELAARIEAVSGVPMARVRAEDGAWCRLHSARDPLAEARQQAAALEVPEEGTAVLLAAGLGYLTEALLVRPDVRVVVIEPSAELIDACLARRDWSTELASGRLHLRRWPDVDAPSPLWQLFDRDEPAPVVFAHPVVERAAPALLRRIRSRITRTIFDGRANADARRRQAGRYLANTVRNLGAIAGSADVTAFSGLLERQPAIVVGAGPSLDRHLEALRNLQSQAVIVAVDTALRPLANAGIRPHLCVALDPSELNARHLTDLPDVRDTWLVAEPSLAPHAFSAFRDRLVMFRVADHHPWPWLERVGISRGLLSVWGSVLTAALDLAILTGADPIVFVGADLALTGGQPYCRGAAWERGWAWSTGRGRALVDQWADDIAGRTVEELTDLRGRSTKTTSHLIAFRDWLLKRMAQSSDRRYVNASGDGILFGEPLELLPLADALSQSRGSSDGIREALAAISGSTRARNKEIRAELTRSVRSVRSGHDAVTREEWEAFGRATMSAADLDLAIDAALHALTANSPPTSGAPAPAGLLPEADRAALLHSALIEVDDDNVARASDANFYLRRALEQLEHWTQSDQCRVDLPPVQPGAHMAEIDRVPPSAVLELRGEARHILAAFEDELARALDPGSGIGDRESGTRHRRQWGHEAPLPVPLLAEVWLAVARWSEESNAPDRPSVVRQVLRAVRRSDDHRRQQHGLALHIGTATPIAIPTPDDFPALTGIVGLPISTTRSGPSIVVRRAFDARPADVPWLQIFDGPVTSIAVERITDRVGRAGLTTSIGNQRAIVTPLDASASLEIDEAGGLRSCESWPRPVWGELPWGSDGGAVAWHNPDKVVLFRDRRGGHVRVADTPFRPLRCIVPDDGVPLWCGFHGGVWRWQPGQEPQLLIETPTPIHFHLEADAAIRIEAATRGPDDAALRVRRSEAWHWRPGTRELTPVTLGIEGQCTSVATSGGWIARAYPYADLVVVTSPKNEVMRLGITYPLTAAWAGGSLVVCTGDLEVLWFSDLTTRLEEAVR